MNTVHRFRVPLSTPLIPAAAGAAQRDFEASLLLAWADATTQLRRTTGVRLPSFIAATHPTGDGLAISVSDPAHLKPLLRHIRPIRSDAVPGIPGLRLHPDRDFLELRLLAAGNNVRARIRLLGVNRRQAHDLLDDLTDPREVPRSPHWDTMPPAGRLLSAVLRRFPLWRAADRIQLGVAGETVVVDWLGMPDRFAVAAVLEQSDCAIQDAGVRVSLTGIANHIVLIPRENPERATVTEPWAAWHVLRVTRTRVWDGMGPAPCLDDAIPPEEWEKPEMRSALAAREVSTVYRLLRRTGVSQRQIAALTGQSQSEVSEILKGRQVMAYDVLARIADGLGVPRGYLGLAYDEVTAVRVAGTKEASGTEETEEVKRRKFLAHAAAVAVGADSGSWVSNPVLAPAPARIGMTDVRQVEAGTRALRRLIPHPEAGAARVRDAAVAQLSWAKGMLAADATDDVRARLHNALADLERLTELNVRDPADHPDLAP